MKFSFSRTRFNLVNWANISYLLFFVSAFWGPALGGISLGPVSLYPARIFALLSWGLLGAAALVGKPEPLGWDSGRQRPIYIFMALWFLWAILSLTWTVQPLQGVRDLFNLFVGLSLVVMAPVFFKSKARLNRAVQIWLFTFVIFMAIAAVEHLTTLHLPISRFSRGYQPHLAFRPTGVFVNENNFAVFISLSIPWLLARWRYFADRRSRLLSGLGIFSAIYLLFILGSRINWIALVAAIFIYSLFLTPRGQRIKVLAALLLLVCATYIIFGVTQPKIMGLMSQQLASLLKAYYELLSPLEGGEYLVSNTSIAIRLNMVRNGLHFLARTWGRGVGVGNFETWIERGAPYDTEKILNPHNWWIELSAEYGLLAALGYLAVYAALAYAAWEGWRRAQGRDRMIPEALALALAVFPLLAISPSSLLDYLPHWLLLAMAMAWHNLHRAGD